MSVLEPKINTFLDRGGGRPPFRKRQTKLILFAFLLCASHPAAQETNLRFKRYTVDDGLSQNNVNCILQDSRGFMWFGTNEGLNRFDGYEFKVYEKDSSDIHKPTDDYILCMLEDSRDRLWIGMGSGGINIYDREADQFTHINNKPSSRIKLRDSRINSIIEEQPGILWIATAISIERIDQNTNTHQQFTPEHIRNDSTASDVINTLFLDSHRRLWFGTSENGLGLFNPDSRTFQYFVHDPADGESISDNDVRTIYEDLDGNLWIGTYNGGLNCVDRKQNRFVRHLPNPKIKESLTVKSILDDGKGGLWIGTRNGLYILNKQTRQFHNYLHDPHDPQSLSQNNVQALITDKKGDFWLGTKLGINYVNTTSLPFAHIRADVYNDKCLNRGFINCIHESRDGLIWIGTDEGGLNCYNAETGRFCYYNYDSNDPCTISSCNVSAITADVDDNLWIGTSQGGLNYFDRKADRFNHYRIIPGKSLLHQPVINSMIFMDDQTLLIGTGDEQLLQFDTGVKAFVPVILSELKFAPSVKCLLRDSDENIWIGGSKSSIYCINNHLSNSQEYTLPLNTRTTMINVMIEDRMKNLWLGTSGSGLVCYSKSEDQFSRYTRADGLPNNHVQSLLIDDHDNIWVSTRNGLAKFNLKTKKIKSYYRENGLQDNHFTSAAYKTRSGKMYFGGINGVTAFYPDEIEENGFIPPVVITDFSIFSKSIRLGDENSILQRSISELSKISLSYKHSSFTFTFAALNYAISEQNQYAYMMEGFEKDWNHVGTRRFATYTNLDPGTYTFKVKAANSDGYWNNAHTSVLISISRPFWKTWWFKVILAAIAFYLIWHFINHQNQKRKLFKATALANLTQLKLLRNQMNPHFLLNTLSAIRALVLLDSKQAWEMISKLSDFLRYILVNYNKVDGTLVEEIEAAKNYICIQKICFHESLKVSYDIDKSAEKCIVPAFIFQPLIENAIKFGSETHRDSLEIEIVMTFRKKILTIDIANKGRLVPYTDHNNLDKAHGTSIKNIEKRLGLMFNDDYSIRIYEQDGWVHSIIKIKYEKAEAYSAGSLQPSTT